MTSSTVINNEQRIKPYMILNVQIEEMLNLQTFQEAINDMENNNIYSSPVFRITNCQSDILRAIKVTKKVEHYLKLFPDNELLNELAKK